MARSNHPRTSKTYRRQDDVFGYELQYSVWSAASVSSQNLNYKLQYRGDCLDVLSIYGDTYSKSIAQPGKVANLARGQLNKEKQYFPLSAFAPENLVSQDGFRSPVPRQPAHLHTQAESGAYLRTSSRVSRRHPFIYFKPPYAIGSVPSLSVHTNAYRWRSLPRVRRHRASKLQGSSERVLPWQVTMDQLRFASLSHTHCWYEVGMLRVPAICTVPKSPKVTRQVFLAINIGR